MKIMVTGGSGFIGSNFIHSVLNNSTHSIINLDSLTYAAHPANLSGLADNSRYNFIKGNICDAKLVAKTIKANSIDAIVHFAAESHVDRSIENASTFITTNILGTQTLIDEARAAKLERFVHVSTDEVYGELSIDEASFSETTPLKPNSPYAASKASSDLLVLAAHKTHNFPGIVTRCSNNYGPRQFPEKLIPLVIYRASNEEKIPVYGDGSNIRDWIYVDDHCQGVVAALEKGKPGEVYNFGGNAELCNLDLVKQILNIMGKNENLINFVTDRLGHDFRYAINFSKASNELGWKPKMSFETGLERTVKWYLENQKWIEQATNKDYQEYYQKQYEAS